MQWSDRIGRRVKLRDLHILLAVAQHGSILRAAEHLAISHPVVSKTVSELEQSLGVKLFDRSVRGVEATSHGEALLNCSVAVFDELRRGVQRLEFLSDPTRGEVRVGGTEPLMAEFIPTIVDRLLRANPQMAFYTMQGDNVRTFAALRHRQVDIVVSRAYPDASNEDFTTEILFDEQLYVVAGKKSRWARHRRVKLADLSQEPWILPEPDTAFARVIAQGFRSMGLPLPRASVVSNSIPLRNRLLSTNRYISVLPRSLLSSDNGGIGVKVLPVVIPGTSQPIKVSALKGRTMTPAVELFVECARDVAKRFPKA